MGRVSQTRRARDDLDEIWLHVALDDPAAADRLVDRIATRCQASPNHPRIGTARPEMAPSVRMLIVDDYLVLYQVDGTDAEIVRVVHGARRLEGLFDGEPEA